MNEELFDIPVVLIFFNRVNTVRQVVEEIRKMRPFRLYLISDGPRADRQGESKKVEECRGIVESLIDWPCEIRRNYAQENCGCYDRIAGGASWVFKQETRAIFLEDDCIPNPSFFMFCRELLEKYENDERILWICGTNYLVEYDTPDGASYLFSKGMYPCGWASWSNKWNLYDGNMKLWGNEVVRNRVLSEIENPTFRRYKAASWKRLAHMSNVGERLYTWDHQWHFIQYANSMFAIVPSKNLITNIGVGPDATHGGVKMTKYLKRLLCLPSYSLEFPLKHPAVVQQDREYDQKVTRLICSAPLLKRISSKIKFIFRFNKG